MFSAARRLSRNSPFVRQVGASVGIDKRVHFVESEARRGRELSVVDFLSAFRRKFTNERVAHVSGKRLNRNATKIAFFDKP